MFVLLVVLHAHEETTYPRRKRIEHSVETDSILAFGVKAIEKLAHDPDETEIQRSGACGSRQRGSTALTVIGTITFVVSTEMLIIYAIFLKTGQLSVQWMQAWVPMAGLSLAGIGTLCFSLTFIGYREAGGSYPRIGCVQDIHMCKCCPNTRGLLNGASAHREITARSVATVIMFLGVEMILMMVFGSADSVKVLGNLGFVIPAFGVVGLFVGAWMVSVAFSDAQREAGTRKEKINGLELEVGDRVEVGSTGIPATDMPEDDRELLRSTSRNTAHRTQNTEPESLAGAIGTVVGVPGQELEDFPAPGHAGSGRGLAQDYNLEEKQPVIPVDLPEGSVITGEDEVRRFTVPETMCVVRLDISIKKKVKALLQTDSNNRTSRTMLVAIANLTDVDWATNFRDVFDDITGRELRRLSFTGEEKYTRQYSRRFRELQCTLIANIHQQEFEKDSLAKRCHLYLEQRKVASQREIAGATIDAAKLAIIEICLQHKDEYALDGDLLDAKSKEMVRRSQALDPEQAQTYLEGLDEEQILNFAFKVDPEALETMLEKHISGSHELPEGPFFAFFKGSLIFDKRAVTTRLWGAGCGGLIGMTIGSFGEDSTWAAPVIAGAIGAALGYFIVWVQGDKDPTAHHLAGHIVDFHKETQEAIAVDAEMHSTNSMAADRVGKMILYLSKARQYKQRQQWRARLWYIAFLHASIPFILTFMSTMSTYAIVGMIYTVVGLLAFAIISTWQETNGEPKDECWHNPHCSLRGLLRGAFMLLWFGVPLLSLIWGMSGTRAALDRLGLQLNTNATAYLHTKLASGDVATDVCGQILDTQGHCCCENTQEVTDTLIEEKF
eukprot:COSAG06_NODE_552_length_14385_cov_7.790424_13_plen_837_part_01